MEWTKECKACGKSFTTSGRSTRRCDDCQVCHGPVKVAKCIYKQGLKYIVKTKRQREQVNASFNSIEEAKLFLHQLDKPMSHKMVWNERVQNREVEPAYNALHMAIRGEMLNEIRY